MCIPYEKHKIVCLKAKGHDFKKMIQRQEKINSLPL